MAEECNALALAPGTKPRSATARAIDAADRLADILQSHISTTAARRARACKPRHAQRVQRHHRNTLADGQPVQTRPPRTPTQHRGAKPSPQQLVDLEKFAAMSPERRNGRLVKLQNAIIVKQREYDQLGEQLKQRFEASKKHLEDLQKKYNPIIKLIRAATPAA